VTEPVFAIYVSAVRGHLVPRWGTNESFGVSKGPSDEEPFVWDESRVYPITEAKYREFRIEFDAAISTGALKRRTAEDFGAYQSALAEREKAEAAKTEARATSETSDASSEESSASASTNEGKKRR